MSNINFLIADVIQFSSEAKINFSHRGAAKIKSKQFQGLAPLLMSLIDCILVRKFLPEELRYFRL